MNIAFLAQSALFQSIQDRVTAFRAPRLSTSPVAVRIAPTWRANAIVQRSHPVVASRPTQRPQRPLRVVRVVEAGQGRAEVGRMVISGRMADVCAELDRLVAREAA